MRQNSYFLSFIIVLFSLQLLAQSNMRDELLQASALRGHGEYKQTLALLEPLVRQSNRSPTTDDGNAWELLGSTYQDLGRYAEAEKAYQNAISILQSQPSSEKYEAAALDDLGSLYLDMGQPEMSRKLRLRVLRIFQAENDHAGVARVYNNLAAVALREDKLHEARTRLEQAFAEMKLLPQSDSADLAAMYNNAGWLAFHGHDYQQALHDYELAMQLWLQLHGVQHELTGWGYILRGRTRLALGQTQPALQDVETGVAIIQKAVGTKVPMFLSARLAYADALTAVGATQQARTVRTETLRSLQSLRHSQSSALLISVEAFH